MAAVAAFLSLFLSADCFLVLAVFLGLLSPMVYASYAGVLGIIAELARFLGGGAEHCERAGPL